MIVRGTKFFHFKYLFIQVIIGIITFILSFLGVIFFEEKIDPDLKYAISRLNGVGIKVWIASGDKRENVISIGRALDLYDPKSIKGDFSDKDKPEDLDIKMSTLLMQFLFPMIKLIK